MKDVAILVLFLLAFGAFLLWICSDRDGPSYD